MKSYKYIFMLLGLLAVSCTEEQNIDNGNDVQGEPVSISFGAGLNDYISRVSQDGSSWNKGDQIGVFAFNKETGEQLTDGNTLYVSDNEGEQVSFSSENPIVLKADGTNVDFVAYYPYSGQIDNCSVSVDISSQSEGSSEYDLLYGKPETTFSYTGTEDTKVNMIFSHSLSKVVLRFTDLEKNPITVTDVQLQGMPVKVSMDIKTGNINVADEVAGITTFATSSGYEAIVVPSNISDTYKVKFKLENGKSREWSFNELGAGLQNFIKGQKYTFNFSVDPNSTTVIGELAEVSGDSSNAPWGDGESADGNATGNISGTYSLFPESNATTAFADTELRLGFTSQPELGTSGYIRIYNGETHELVDEINMSERPVQIQDGITTLNSWMDIVGVAPTGSSTASRVVNYLPVKVDGNSVVIKPHQHRLDFNSSYYVVISSDAIIHDDFNGIFGRAWKFTTKEKPSVTTPSAELSFSISHTNPDADFYTLQGAIDYCARNVSNETQKVFTMDDGIYEEIIYLRDQSNITIKGNSQNNTAVNIRYYNYNSINGGIGNGINIDQDAPVGTVIAQSGGRCVIMLDGNSNRIRFENLTIENSYAWTYGNNGQAEALYINNKSAAFVNCRVLGNQDTMLPGGGYNWFKGCYIAGGTDFIWGSGEVVLFEECQLDAPNGTRAVMQARVGEGKLGYVFKDCRFTVGEGVESSSLIYQYAPDNLTFLNCTFADVYGPGFSLDSKPFVPSTPSLTEGCKMYLCTTESGANLYDKIPENVKATVKVLTYDEYNQNFATREKIMSWNGNTDASWFKE